MRAAVLLREATAAARASLVPTALVALVIATTCVAAVLTVGRQAAAEAALARELAGPAARTLTLTQNLDGASLTPQALSLLVTLNGTDAVIATDLPVDAVNGALGTGSTPVAVVGVHGTVASAVTLTRGRLPGPGEAIVPAAVMARLGLAEPVGYLQAADGTQWSVVGSFAPKAPFDDLADVALTMPEPSSDAAVAGDAFHQVRVVADDVSHVKAVQDATLAIVDPDAATVQVTAALAAAGASQRAAGTLAGLGRSLLLVILGAGAFFVAVVVLADVLIRRRDLGRRRTLGITRGALVGLVAARTAAPALVGAALGSAAGCAQVWHSTGQVPVAFAAATATLGVLTAAAACLPPAIYAARRDPVEVMRTP
ncbi:MAG: hypothetical protein KQH57_17550 [Actinomycetales bacterium]|nr:hypothetical protein [Actinomycetales bacterium]